MQFGLRRVGAGWLSGGLSTVAILISVTTFYFSFLQGADPSLKTGRTMTFARNQATGFYTFNLPVTFVNSGGGNAVAEAIRIAVSGPDGAVRIWDAEDLINEYELGGPFAPVNIPGRQAVTEAFRFNPIDREDTPIFPDPGVYRLEVSALIAGEDTALETERFTQILADDLPYIDTTLAHWPLVFEVVPERNEVEAGRSYLRRW